MDPRVDMRGIVTVLNTPFDGRGDLDLPALARHVRYALEAVLSTVARSRPVVAGVYADDADARLDLVREPSLPFDANHEAQADYLIDYAIELTADVRAGRA